MNETVDACSWHAICSLQGEDDFEDHHERGFDALVASFDALKERERPSGLLLVVANEVPQQHVCIEEARRHGISSTFRRGVRGD